MGRKKAEEKRTFTEAEIAGTSEEERELLEAEPTEEGKEGEPEGEAGKPKEEAKPKEPDEKKPEEGEGGEKPKEEGKEEGAEPPEGVEGEKVTIVVDGEKIEGAIAKGGNYIIPYAEVQKRDEKYGRAKTENEALKAEIAALLKAKPPEPKAEEKPPAELDLDALEAKLYETDDVKGFLKDLKEQIEGAAKPPEEKPEGEVEVRQETPDQIAMRTKDLIELESGLKAMVKEYPKIDNENEAFDEKADFLVNQMGVMILGKKMKEIREEGEKVGKTKAEYEADQIAWGRNPENLLAVQREAIVKTEEVLGGGSGESNPEKERETIRTEERGKALEWVKTHFNITEDEVKTLGDVRDGSGDTGIGTFSHLDGLGPEELEDALSKMTKEQREKYTSQPPTE